MHPSQTGPGHRRGVTTTEGLANLNAEFQEQLSAHLLVLDELEESFLYAKS